MGRAGEPDVTRVATRLSLDPGEVTPRGNYNDVVIAPDGSAYATSGTGGGGTARAI